jgi:Tfp pilus assembly protein PilF
MSSERAEQLKEILKDQPENSFARYALGIEYASAGETDAALAEFRGAVTLDAKNANAFLMGAQALQQAERIAEAIEWLHEGIACAKRLGNRHAESEMQSLLDELEP